MSQMTKVFSILSLYFFMTQSAFSALVLDNTRYIYKEEANSISGSVKNESGDDFGAQIWVESLSNDEAPSFITSPSFFKIKSKGEQLFRIIKVSRDLPKDKESLYWFNLQEIPQIKKGSGISLAIRTKVKLIFRPKQLLEGREGAESEMTIKHLPDGVWLVNTTPYIFAIGSLFNNEGKVVKLDRIAQDKLSTFEPGDRINITGKEVRKVAALNDFGNLEYYELK